MSEEHDDIIAAILAVASPPGSTSSKGSSAPAPSGSVFGRFRSLRAQLREYRQDGGTKAEASAGEAPEA